MRVSGSPHGWVKQLWHRIVAGRRPAAFRPRWRRTFLRPGLDRLEDRLAPAVTLSMSDPLPLREGDSGSTNMIFTVTRSGDLSGTTQVNYTTQDGAGANGAKAGIDYVLTSGSLTFTPNQTTAVIAVPVIGNTIFQSDRSFTVTLSNLPVAASFAIQQTFGVGGFPTAVEAADFNGDGKPDIVVTDGDIQSVAVLLNTTAPGATTASFAPPQTFFVGRFPTAVAVADVNGDGKPDIIASSGVDATVSVLLNTTATGGTIPSFASKQSFATGNRPYSVAMADINGDGKPDIVVANRQDATISVLLNTTATGASTATFSNQQTFATGNQPYSVTVADINGDGKPDVVTANRQDATVSVLLNTTATGAASSTFANQQNFAVGRAPFAVAAADINGDGKPDLITANTLDQTVSVLLNTTATGAASASFTNQQAFAASGYSRSVLVTDVNGDGKPDVVVANNSPSTAGVLVNTTAPGAASASFANAQSFPAGNFPYGAAVADINGDGKTDLLIANYSDKTVSVLLNTNSNATIIRGTATGTIRDDDAPVAVTAVAGTTPQSASINTAFGNRLSVLVVNANGNPVQGVSVTFSAPASAASGLFASNATVLTDASGIAQAPAFTANGAAGIYQITATATGGGNPSATFNLTNTALADLSVSVDDGATTAVPGSTVTYTITVANNGPYALSSVQLTTALPAALSNVLFTPSTASYDPVTGNWTGLSLAQGQSITLTLSASIDPAATGNLTVNATVTPPFAVSDPISGNNTSSDTDTLTPQGDLQVTVSNGQTIPAPGTVLTFSVVVTNTGVSQAAGVAISDLFPAALIGVTWTSRVTGGTVLGNTASGSGNLNDTVTLGPGSSLTYTVMATVAANAIGTFSNTVAATTPAGFSDPVPSNNAATDTILVLTPDERFVQALYRAELGRAGSLPEIDGWVRVLHSPAGSRAVVVNAIAHSNEALRDLVDSWYATYLGRPAQNGEEMGWVNLLQSQTEERVLSYILGSTEFFNRAQTLVSSGTPPERSVEALYQLVLSRTGSTAEADGWVSLLPQISQQGVALAFLQSQEYRSDLFTLYYSMLLHRAADQPGLHGWIFSNFDVSGVRGAFESSPEFYSNG